MNRKLGEINRGGSSIRIGSIGTISSLMSKELETSSSSSQRNPQSAPVSVSCGERTFKLRKSVDEVQKTGTRSNKTKQRSPENTRGPHQDRISVLGLATPKPQKQKVSMEEARSSRRSPEFNWKTRSHKITHHVPMLESEDKTIKRDKAVAWKVNLVEVVDTNCGIPAGTLSSRLKKLGFAKLSQSII